MLLKLDDFASLVEAANGGVEAIQDHIVVGDCLAALQHLPDGCVDLVHTSPPYNIDKAYKSKHRDRKELDAYMEFLRAAICELKRVLKPNGSIFWQTGYTQLKNGIQGDILPIDLVTYPFFREAPNAMILWDRIIWRYFGGLAFKRKFTNKHETILWFVKPSGPEANPHFDVDPIRERSRELDKRNNFWGRNPGNVWEVDRVAYGTTEQSSHIAVYPEEIAEKIVRSASRPGDLVLDPFSGSGTTPKVARSLGRHWLGIEISPEYARESAKRIGFEQPQEEAVLCSALIKYKVFGGKISSLPVAEAGRRLRIWAKSVDLAHPKQLLGGAIRKALRSPNGKDAKPEIWDNFENLIEHSTEDPVVEADAMLCAEYKNRRNLNGVRRYQTALHLLESVRNCVLEGSDDAVTSQLERIAYNEPSSYRVAEGSIRLAAVQKRLKPQARGSGNGQAGAHRDDRAALNLRPEEYQPTLLPGE